jgi:hypothetical protein
MAIRISARSRSWSPRPARGLFGAFRLAEAYQGLQQQCPYPHDEQVRCGEEPGQSLGGQESGQRVGVPAASQLKQPAEVVHPDPRRGLGFRPDRALGALDPALCLLEPPLPGQHGCKYRVGSPPVQVRINRSC